MEENHKIYLLSSSEFPTYFRYVGRTMRELNYRLAEHIREIGNTYKNNWIKKEIKKGNKIVITEIESNINKEEIPKKEVYYFKLLFNLGYKLTNGTESGEGVMIPTEQTKLKMSRSKKGKPNGREGKKMPKEFGEKMSLIHKGKEIPQEMRSRISNTLKGRKPLKSTIEKAAEINRKIVVSLDEDGKILNVFNSLAEASIFFNISPSYASSILNKRYIHKKIKLDLL